jgi:GNAT superfamily N-acetyltransferase
MTCGTEWSSRIERREVPLPEDLTDELIAFWEDIFGGSCALLRPVLLGDECEQNRDVVTIIREGRNLAGTCHLTLSISNPELGGLGEVGASPKHRGRGIATALCEQAREEARSRGCRALFLGTVNPAAARVYARTGWLKLPGADVMASIPDRRLPEDFLHSYFDATGPVTLTAPTANDRIPVIPLVHSPHTWRLMDLNVNLLSTRYVVHSACMGLYPRYQNLTVDGKGTWYGARTERGRLVGLSTARLVAQDECRVDGFVHHAHRDVLEDLVRASVGWGADQGASVAYVSVCTEDEDKRLTFESMGFCESGRGGRIELNGRPVPLVRLARPADAE